MEGYNSGYEGGLFADHENLTQQAAGLVGTAASYLNPGYAPLAAARDFINAPKGYGEGIARNATFLGSWITGSMPSEIVYDEKSSETMDMRNSPGVNKMRSDFYLGKDTSRMLYDTFEAAKDTLLYPKQWASIALEVGGFARAKITDNGDGTVTFNVPNRAGAKSFFYHALPDLPRSWGNVPMHNVEQKFIWTEPIK